MAEYHLFRVTDSTATSVSFEQEAFDVEDGHIVVQPHQVDRIRGAEHLRRHLAYAGRMPEGGLASLSPLGDTSDGAGSSETGGQSTRDADENELAEMIRKEDEHRVDGQPIPPAHALGVTDPGTTVVTTPAEQ